MTAKRTKKHAARHILLYEALGFFGIVLLVWLSEMPDLPSIFFGMEATPVNWSEMFIETAGVVLLAVWVIFMTARHLRRIQYLEGFLNICASCKKIHVGGEWVPFEDFIGERSDAVFSHGFCPDCAGKFLEEDLEQTGPRRRNGVPGV